MNLTSDGMTRRQFIGRTALAGAAAASLSLPQALTAKPGNANSPLIDVNVTLGHWPMRRLPLDDPEAFAGKLRARGVAEAWACTFEALLQGDLASVNRRLARACKSAPKNLFVPFGAVNPSQPWWKEDLRRCQDEHGMPGIRLYPNYHGYTLDAPAVAELLTECTKRKLIVQIAATLEDVRVQQPRMKADPVDLKPLPGLLENAPGLKLVLLNWNRAINAKVVPGLASKGQVWADIATQEGVAGISGLLRQVPANAVLFGSHSPYYYFESAMLKLTESELSSGDLAAISFRNAAALRRV